MKIRGIAKSVLSETGEEKVTYVIGDTENPRHLATATVTYDRLGVAKISKDLLESLMGIEEGV